jgi:glycosyltransferase involved in cell wall biosynthesis
VKVAVVTAHVPFVRGGAEALAEGLRGGLQAAGAQVELVGLPFAWHPPSRLLDSIVAARLWRIGEADRVIALKFPAYCLEHPDKVVWMLHQHRPAYDLWDHALGGLRQSAKGEATRDAVRRADGAWLGEARRVHTISRVVTDRLRRFNGIESTVLSPPLPDPSGWSAGPYGDYLFYPSRLAANKRQRLVVEAMRHVRSGARLVLAGAAATPADEEALRSAIARHGLGDRVTLIARWLPEAEKRELLAGALAVPFVPFDEDYGYVALEAAAAARPVIACTDSGGTELVVRDGETGIVCEPDPRAIAEAIDRLMADRREAQRLGRNARDLLESLDLRWERVAQELLA